MKRTIFLLLLCVVSIGEAIGQSYSFRSYRAENGLSYNSVICSIQDSKGFMWFGTKDGLNKFDGYTFKVFRNDKKNPKSIGSNFIHSIYEDQHRVIWVGTLKGLYQYNTETEEFILLKPSLNSDIRDVKADHEGNIWYIAGDNLSRYNQKTGTVETYQEREFFNATSICIRTNGEVWIATARGDLQQYDARHNSFKAYNVFHQSKPVISNWIDKIYDTGQNSLLVGTSNQGVKLFDLGTKTYKDILTYSPADQTEIYARDFIRYSEQEYWIATESGLFIYNMATGKYLNLRKKHGDPYSISDNAVYTFCKDKEGGIWLGTYFGGLNYYPKPYMPFEKFFFNEGANSLYGNAVREITKDDFGHLWIGTEDGGLNKFNPQNGHFEHFSPDKKSGSVSHYNIHGLLADGKELWIGTFERGLDVLDIPSGKVVRHYVAGPGPGNLKSNFIESLCKTSAGKILVGTSAGLHQYNRASNDFTQLPQFPAYYHYAVLLEDPKGTLWAATLRDGLYFYNPSTGKTGYYKNDPKDENSLSSNSINGLFLDHMDRLWVSTENGLCRLDEKKGKFSVYEKKDGFPSNVFYNILEDQQHLLWISTSKGLVCFNPSTGSTKSYTNANGLLGDQFNYSSGFKDSGGRMYFGSLKGFIRFDPNCFIKNNFTPPVYITNFQVFNQDLPINKENSPLSKSINFTNEITLKYEQSTFNIDFSALSYTAPEMTEYRYKMEGMDKKWTHLKNNQKVYFTKLLPGSYEFMVQASSDGGKWDSKITVLKIRVLPPFWASNWAFAFYIVLLTGIVYYLVRNYHQRTEARNRQKFEALEVEKEKEVYRAKIEFFTYLTHEIRTPLTLIKGPLEDVMKQSGHQSGIQGSLLTMEKNTNRLLELTNQLLDFRKTEQKGFSLNFVLVNISELLEQNYLQFQGTAVLKGISFAIDLPGEILFAYADPEALNKILSNLLDNAVKYAAKKVLIRLRSVGQDFRIEIKNDGQLIPERLREKIFEPFFRIGNKNNGTGIGLPLARSLALLHEGRLDMEFSNEQMNTFVLELPLHHHKEFIIEKVQSPPENEALSEGDKESGVNPRATLLLVEDNKDVRTFIAGVLARDYQVLQAADGDKAQDMMEDANIQLVISDVVMPGMDGFELCRRIKENADYTHTPVILLTARNDLHSRIEGLESGADAYIEKPFSPEHLLSQVHNLLAAREKMRSHYASSPVAHLHCLAHNQNDKLFLDKLDEVINKHMAGNLFDVDHLAEAMNMSRPTLYRKIKSISNLSPHALINISRLKKGAALLVESDYKIYKIATMIGFNSQAQFTRSFQKQFGITPKKYANSKK